MTLQESVTLIADIGANTKNDGAAFTTKLARPLNLPGQWRVSIMDISYPHQWSTIHRDITFAVMMPFAATTQEYDHNFILSKEQPVTVGKGSVITEKPEMLSRLESKLFTDLKFINFQDRGARYEVLTDTISEGEHSDPKLIVEQIASKITTLYRRRFPEYSANEYENIVTYNPITRRVTFKNLMNTSYCIVSPSDESIISMLGHDGRSIKIPAVSDRELDVLPVETQNSANSILRHRNPLRPIEKVNLRTLDNVFVYTDIIEQSLIGESQANLLGYFPIKSNFGETGYWCFNPPYDYKVIKNSIDTITIKLTRMNGDLFPFKNGKIVIRLLFKRVS